MNYITFQAQTHFHLILIIYTNLKQNKCCYTVCKQRRGTGGDKDYIYLWWQRCWAAWGAHTGNRKQPQVQNVGNQTGFNHVTVTDPWTQLEQHGPSSFLFHFRRLKEFGFSRENFLAGLRQFESQQTSADEGGEGQEDGDDLGDTDEGCKDKAGNDGRKLTDPIQDTESSPSAEWKTWEGLDVQICWRIKGMCRTVRLLTGVWLTK